MGLQDYRRKRNFRKTPEPSGSARARSGDLYLVQKHDASSLHYDLRLQVGDVLASWAVPKGPSLDPADKRLAVHVEDHPLEYAEFEGVIPEGEYGGGTVLLWDRGTWEPHDDDPERAIKKGKLTFTLRGKRLKGDWTLTRMRRAGETADNWLLIKHDDRSARKDAKPDSDRVRSVVSGRTMRQIARDQAGDAPPKRNRKVSKAKRSSRKQTTVALDPAPLDGARPAPMPRAVTPQLCTLVDRTPRGEDWVHEIKLDGYRMLIHKSGDRVRLMTRAGKDWTAKFPPIARAIARVPIHDAVIDGEVVIMDEDGRTSFQRLQNAVKSGDFDDLAFCAFDLPYAEGHDLTRCRLLDRKALLRSMLEETDDGVLRFSDHIEGAGADVYTHACRLQLEGVISKKADAPYTQARSRSWMKVKCTKRQEFVIIGWTAPSGSRKHLGSLLLAAHDAQGRLAYTGRVGTGFTQASLRDLRARLDPIDRESCPADIPPSPDESRGARWVSPKLIAEVEFTEWTDDRRLRHPSFKGLREDKPPAEIRVERPQKAPRSTSVRRSPRARADADHALVAGVRITHPDRVVYPDQGVTKLELAQHYERIAEHMLPFIAGRPLSTVRCPAGRTGQCFFQKHLRETFGDPVKSIRVRESSGTAEYIAVDSAAGLVALVQFGVLEVHVWGSTEEHVEQPDTLTFDLDPDSSVPFDRVKDGALRVREALERAGLRTYLKTTGGKGLHVVAPIRPEHRWSEVKAFCADVARSLVAADPGAFIATASKARRKGKVFIDYLRNARGATAIAPYSTRARPGAPIATPLRWDELARLDASNHYDLSNIHRRLAALKRDPWSGYTKRRALAIE